MKILDRYIAVHTLWGILLVSALLLILFSFIELLSQINDIGKGDFTMADAFAFVALTVPKRIVDILPIGILLGSIIALGLLADRNELVAMQATGTSAQKICLSVISAGTLLIVIAFLVAEFVAPPIDQRARLRRAQALYGKSVMLTENGFWTRHQGSIIHVGKTFSDTNASDLEVYQLDEQGHLVDFMYAREASISENNQWLLKDIEKRTFSQEGIQTQRLDSFRLDSFLSPEQVGILELPPDSLSISDLYYYVQGLKERGQNAERYQLSFWQKLSLPLTNLAMVLVSLTFIFGPTRARTAGKRIVLAAMAGIALYLLNQIIGQIGLLFNLHPALTTMAPVVIILLFALWLLKDTA
jgi:lipopolysaccharide export system permease protein